MGDSLSGSGAEHRYKSMSVKDALETFGKRVQQQARANLTKEDKKDTGKLYNSVKYDLAVHKNSFHLSFALTDYAMFVDRGVKGWQSGARAVTSPFRFGSGTGPKGGLTIAIKAWVRRKRIQFRDRHSGMFLTYDQTAWIITKSIYAKGLWTSNFFSKPFENEFKKLPDEVTQKFGLELEKFIKFTLKK